MITSNSPLCLSTRVVSSHVGLKNGQHDLAIWGVNYHMKFAYYVRSVEDLER